MNRRVFLSAVTGGLLAAPLAAGAQVAGSVARNGYLEINIAADDPALRAFVQRLLLRSAYCSRRPRAEKETPQPWRFADSRLCRSTSTA